MSDGGEKKQSNALSFPIKRGCEVPFFCVYYTGVTFSLKGSNIMLDKEENKKVDRQVKKFMKVVKDYLTVKGGGVFPPEWELSKDLLETFYRQFLVSCVEIEKLDCLYVDTGRGGGQKEHPLLSIRDKAAIRIEGLMKQMGLTMKSGLQMGTTDVKKEETPLDAFFKVNTQK